MSLVSQSLVQADHSPVQSMSATQPPFPGKQSAVTVGHAAPFPEGAAVSVQPRASLASQSLVQALQWPTQSVLTGQPPWPGMQSSASSGHAAPSPLCAVVTMYIRLAAVSHALVQEAQRPTQSTSGGHAPSPGSQLFMSLCAWAPAAPPLDACCVTLKTRLAQFA